MRLKMVAAVALATSASFADSSAQNIDMAAVQRWASVAVVHYEIVGENRSKHVQIPPTDADLYGDVLERVRLSFDWDVKKKAPIGAIKITNEPAQVTNLEGIGKECPAGKLNGAFELFDVDTATPVSGGALRLVGRRIHPDTLVTEACGKNLRPYKGAVVPQEQVIAVPEPAIMAFPSTSPTIRKSADGKSLMIGALNDSWVWTLTPTPK